MIQENFIKIYEKSFKKNWELPALTDYSKGTTFSFADVAKEIARIHILFEECQIRRGDKIALIGKDSARWCIVYMAAVTYGAIIVPILQDFSPNDVHHIINHSESVFLFVSDRIWDTLEEEMIEDVRGVFSLSDFRCLHQRDGESIQKLLKGMDEKMAEKYPEGELNHFYVDNAAMQIVRNPKQFDVILTSNIFGDILSDEASQVTGSIGMLPSASLAEGSFGMYEPIHGSAPDIAGRDIANPMATILSAAMMLRYTFGLGKEADAVENAVKQVLADGVRTGDIAKPGEKVYGTVETGKLIAEAIK